jgi:hypothetical protein
MPPPIQTRAALLAALRRAARADAAPGDWGRAEGITDAREMPADSDVARLLRRAQGLALWMDSEGRDLTPAGRVAAVALWWQINAGR